MLRRKDRQTTLLDGCLALTLSRQAGIASRTEWFAHLSVRRRLTNNKVPQPGRKVRREGDALTACLPFFLSSPGLISVEYGIDDDSDDPEDQARVLRRTGAVHLSCTQRVHASIPDNRTFGRPAKSAPTQQIGSASQHPCWR